MAFTTTQPICKINFPGTHTFLSRLDFYGEKKRTWCAKCSELACRQNKGITYLTKDKVMQLENAGLQTSCSAKLREYWENMGKYGVTGLKNR